MIDRELNPEFASRRERVQGVSVPFGFEAILLKVRCQPGKGGRDHDDVGIESINRLDVTVDRQAADQK